MQSNLYPKAYDVLRSVRHSPEQADQMVRAYLNVIFCNYGLIFEDVQVRIDSPVALNSLHGLCVTKEGKKLFFKFHAEENEEDAADDGEMYAARILIDQGWNVMTPFASSKVKDAQCELYEWVFIPTVYTVLRDLEASILRDQKKSVGESEKTLAVLEKSIKSTGACMLRSFERCDESLPEALIHRLFSHRLNSVHQETPRIELFYGGTCADPKLDNLAYVELFEYRWLVNGQEIPWTVSELIKTSKELLDAKRSRGMPSVIGHGDEHFANQFFLDDDIMFFDPAFAGRMPALLAMVKATAHNVIAHPFWFYEPFEISDELECRVTLKDNVVTVDHNWQLARQSPIRLQILRYYIDYFWEPLLVKMQQQQCLPTWWKEYVRAAIFCSPFLAKNIGDVQQFPCDRILFNFAYVLEATKLIDDSLDALCGTSMCLKPLPS